MKETQYTPLSPEEQVFAEKHHYLIDSFLRSRKLPQDEWYDIVIFRYLLSVKKWFQQPELHRYKFSTISWKAMSSAVHNEREKQKRRIQTVSLDSPIPGSEDMTLMDTITYENLQYLYIGEENMKISYNVKVPPRKMPGTKSEEVTAVENFITSMPKTKNICFEYDELQEAKSKTGSMQTWRRKNNFQDLIDVFRIGMCMYVVKKGGK